jgi:hypothetical protein
VAPPDEGAGSERSDGDQEKAPAHVHAEPGKGVTFETEDERYKLNLVGRFTTRETFTVGQGDGPEHELTIRHARLVFEGNVFAKGIEYFLQVGVSREDFDDADSLLFDAYVAIPLSGRARIRVGQFYVPYDRARQTAFSNQAMVDRAEVVREFALGRDVGVQAIVDDPLGVPGNVTARAALLSGTGRQVTEPKDSLLPVARLSAQPLGRFDDDKEGDLEREKKLRLSVGIAGAYSMNAPRSRGPAGTPLRLGGFRFVHAAADVVVKYAGWSLFAEALGRTAVGPRVRTGLDEGEPVTEWARSGFGYFVQTTLMVSGSVGASARFGELRPLGRTAPELEDDIASRGRELGAALSWFIRGHDYKLQGDYFYQFGSDVSNPRHQARVQLLVSF